jgi:hypothetical protein
MWMCSWMAAKSVNSNRNRQKKIDLVLRSSGRRYQNARRHREQPYRKRGWEPDPDPGRSRSGLQPGHGADQPPGAQAQYHSAGDTAYGDPPAGGHGNHRPPILSPRYATRASWRGTTVSVGGNADKLSSAISRDPVEPDPGRRHRLPAHVGPVRKLLLPASSSCSAFPWPGPAASWDCDWWTGSSPRSRWTS